MTVHDRPAKRIDFEPFVRYTLAFGGLAILGYFIYQIIAAKHLAEPVKLGVIAVIVVIGIGGAMAVLQRDEDVPVSDDRRLYTAEEVAELLNLVRANGGRLADAANAACRFCGKAGADVRGLDGTRYHRPCFQRAYREREATTRRSTRFG